MPGFGFGFSAGRGAKRRLAASVSLNALTLSASSAAENSAQGTVVGSVLGKAAGSALSLLDNAGGRFALDGSNRIVTGPTALDYETGTSHNITIRETKAGATNSPNDTVLTINVTDVDEVAPVLSGPTASATGGTTANIGVTSDEANGTLYWAILPAASAAPDAAAFLAGTTGGVATGSTNSPNAGSNGFSPTGLTSETAYKAHFFQQDAAGNDSIVVSSGSFTTADITAPTLSSPTDAANGSTGATLAVTTSEGNGTLYWYISTSATPPSATDLKAGTGAVANGSQAVSATGVQNVTGITGLTASTTYYAHFLHEDAANNPSAIVSGDGFTTSAASGTVIGSLPTLPGSYDALVTNATEYRNAITAAPASGAYYIAVQDGAVIDLGSTNSSSGGFTDYTLTTNKDIVVAPQSWYAGSYTYMSDPFGDGNQYTRMVVRPCTIIGWQSFTGGNPKMYGMKRTISLFPATPTSTTWQGWGDIGVAGGSLDTCTGATVPDFSWNEYFIGKDASHTPFDVTVKEYDMRSPDAWCFVANSALICRARGVNASFTSGTDIMTVNSITKGSMPIAVGHYVSVNVAGVPTTATIIALGTGTGGTGTYQLSVTATATATVSATISTHENSVVTGVGTAIYDGWGDTDFGQYNRFAMMPTALSVGLNSAPLTSSGATVTHNYIHDLADGITSYFNHSGVVAYSNKYNYETRLYGDYNTVRWANAATKLILQRIGNIATEPACNPLDSRNRHGDVTQAYGQSSGTTTGSPLPHWRSIGNLAAVSANCRGQFQDHFFQMVYDYYLMGMKVKNCIGLSVNKFVSGQAQHSPWLKNNVGVTQELPRPNYNPSSPSTISWKSTVAIDRDNTSTSIADSQMVIENVVCEGLVLDASKDRISYQTSGLTALSGAQGRNASSVFVDLNRTLTTVNDMFLAAKELQPGKTGLSVNTLAEMMVLADEHEVGAFFVPQAGANVSTTITTSKAYIHGIVGTNVAVVPDAGVSWETYDAITGAVVRAMSTGSGTAQAGQLISWQGQSSASYLTETGVGGTIDGVAARCRVITKSNTFFITADNGATEYSRIAKPSDARTFNGFIVALIGLKLDSWVNNAVIMEDKNTNAYLRIALNTLSPGRFTTNWLGSTSTEGGSAATFDVGTDTTNRHTFIFAGDFTQTDSSQVIRLMKDYTPVNLNGVSNVNASGTKTFGVSQFFGASGLGVWDQYAGGMTKGDGSLQGIWIELFTDASAMPDIANVDVINSFTADRLNVAGDGSVAGVLPRPMVFLQGDLTQWNSSVPNLGYGGGSLTKQSAGSYA